MICRKLSIISAFPFIIGILASCTSTRNYDAQLDTWVGKSEKDLIAGWGMPDKQYQVDSATKTVSYIKRSTVAYPDTRTTCVGTFGGTAASNGCGSLLPAASTYTCETTFTLVKGMVARWKHQGNNCRS